MPVLRHLKAWLRRGRLDDQLRDELAQHVAWRAESLQAEGVPEQEARRRAAVEVGNVTRLREESRDVWGFPRLDSILQDARYGLRQMRRAPMFTTIAILSLGVGVGASAAVFSLADSMVLRRLPVKNPEELVVLKWYSGPAFPFVSLNGNGDQTPEGVASTSFARITLDEMRVATQGRMDLLGFADLYDVSVSADGRAEVANAHAVSGNYFEMLGITAAAGRLLNTTDERDEAPPAAVISDAYWRRRFGRSTDAIGRPLAINGLTFTIAGVTSAVFQGISQVADAPDVFVPLRSRGRLGRSDERDDDPTFWWVLLVGRIHPGTTAAELQPALDAVLKRTTAASRPALAAKDLPSLRLLDGSRGQHDTRDRLREPLRTMAIVVTIVLLVACANVANLLLARGQARARELSVRTAIGAGRLRVVRQLFTEGALLAVFGAALGLISARWISGALMPALTTSPGAAALPVLDWRLVLFVTSIAAGCAILFALAPAVRATRDALNAGLREASTRFTASRRGRLAGSLVVVQLALSMVLVVTAALLARSLWNLDHAELGFDVTNVLTFSINPSLNGYQPDRVRGLATRIQDGLRGVPGVVGVTFTSHPLLANQSAIGVTTTPSETPPDPGSAEAGAFRESHATHRQVTGPDFFSTLRIPIIRGRALDERDASTGPKVLVVNRALARKLFQTEDVIGQRLRLGMRVTAPVYEIVGVSGDARYTSVRDDSPPTLYLPAAQQPLNAMTFEVRTSGNADAAAATVRDVVRRIDDQLPLMGMRTLSDQLARSLQQERLFARLALWLGTVTLALSAIGLYGLLAYGVALRVPEIGLRMALGAERRSVGWMVLRQSLALAAIGLAFGVAAAVAGTSVIASLLYQLPARDPLTMATAGAIMLATCVLAGYLPARRAARVDPLTALRAE